MRYALVFTFLILVFANFYGQVTFVLHSGQEGKDSEIWSNGLDNAGADPNINVYTWTNSGQFALKRSLVEFDLSSFSGNLIEAKLSLYYNPDDQFESVDEHSGMTDLFIERITSSWQEDAVNWNNQPSTTINNRVSVPSVSSGTQDFIDLNVTDLVRDMMKYPESSFGFMLRMQDEVSPYRMLILASSDHPNPDMRPKLKLTLVQEICDNGKDDDGDGLIDCFDDDCCDNINCDSFWFDVCPADGCLFQGSTTFTIEGSSFDGIDVTTYGNIVTGDLDQDGTNEIVSTSQSSIVVMDAQTEMLKFEIPVMTSFTGPLAIGEIVSASSGAEIVYDNGISLFAFAADGNLLWTNPLSGLSYSIALADFDGDGKSEVYSEYSIFNGETGSTIVSIPGITSSSGIVGMSVAVDIFPDSYCPNCQGLEFIANSQIYAVDIATGSFDLIKDYSGTMGSSSLNLTVDWDRDGFLEILSMGWNRIDVWEPETESTLYTMGISSVTKGYPNVGDLDGDGFPELVFIDGSNNGTMRAIDNDFGALWTLNVDDQSGFTGITLFDFDADGSTEIVYRDEQNLRIINGQGGSNIQLIPCSSVTGAEFPIVADYNRDGEAEILVVCGDEDLAVLGNLYAFSSGSGSSWANCRPVWNQINYFNVHVNDDLSIPRCQQQHHLVGDSIVLNTYLNQYLILERLEADLELASIVNTDCGIVSLEVCNVSEVTFNQSVQVSIYDNDPTSIGGLMDNSSSLSMSLLPGECDNFIISIDSDFVGDAYFIINDSGLATTPLTIETDFPTTPIAECDYLNNISNVSVPPCMVQEICDNNIDDDGDGLVDCEDPDCKDLEVTVVKAYFCGAMIVEICDNSEIGLSGTVYVSIYEVVDNELVSLITVDSVLVWFIEDTKLCYSFTVDIPVDFEGKMLISVDDSGITSLPVELNSNFANGAIVECDESNNTLCIEVMPPGSFSLGMDTILCSSNSLELTGPDGLFHEYEWSTGDDSQMITVTTSNTYVLTITNAYNFCTSDSIVVIFENPDMEIVPVDLCKGDSILIEETWIIPDTDELIFNHKNIYYCDSIIEYQFTYYESIADTVRAFKCPDVSYYYSPGDTSIMDPGQYIFTFDSQYGCDSTHHLILADYQLDQYNVETSPSCIGESNGSATTTFINTDEGDYSYMWPAGESTDNEAIDNLGPDTYIVTVTDANSCNFEIAFDISDYQLDQYNVEALPSCPAENSGSATITFQNTDVDDYNYSWPAGESTSNQALNNLSPDTYVVTIIDANSCEYEIVFDITEHQLDQYNVEALPSCPDESSGSATITFQNTDVDDYSYSWPAGESTSNEALNNLSLDTYVVTVIDANSCEYEIAFDITEHQLDQYNVETLPSCTAENNGSATITFQNTNVGDYTYSWPAGESTSNQALNNLSPDTYVVTIIDANLCEYEIMFDVEAYQPPQYTINFSPIICEDGEGYIAFEDLMNVSEITVNGEVISGFELPNLSAAEYNIDIVDVNGCLYSETIEILMNSGNDLSIPDIIYVQADTPYSIEVSGSNLSLFEFEWGENDYLSCTSCRVTSITTSDDQSLTVTATDQNGCISLLTTLVIVELEDIDYYIPNVFNPISLIDENRNFKIFFSEDPVKLDILIYDRWGNLIFHSDKPSQENSWDGSFKGKILNPGVFVYLIKAEFDKGQSIKVTGDITLIR